MTLQEPISKIIWDLKYRYRQDGQCLEDSIEQTWHRVARAIAQAEKPKNRTHWEKSFYQILEGFYFLPGGRILAGAGTRHQVTLLNCFVMNIAEDSLKGIFNGLQEGALTLQAGGGVGYDFSILRPAGDEARQAGNPASGPVSFMRIWDAMCSVMLSTGARRGAMMGVLRCDHPDIETFVQAKYDATALRHFNVSVMVTDEFMRAVHDNKEWPLVFPDHQASGKDCIHRVWPGDDKPVKCRIYRLVSARELWNKIIRAAYDCAEPGVLFADTINRKNTLWYREHIAATNPCGEIPLPAYGACDLGSINLTQFVVSPFTSKAALNWQKLEETAEIATRFLDNVLDVSYYPLAEQAKQAKGSRRIGLGLTGLADMLVMLGMRYGSEEAIAFSGEVMRRIAHTTWYTSIRLGQEKGVFPFYHHDYVSSEFIESLDDGIRQQLALHGVRNSHHNTIAPAGTISLLANNVSNGIEPVFQATYDRFMYVDADEKQKFQVQDYAFCVWQQTKPQTEKPSEWVDINDLSPMAHLKTQAAMQPYIDNAISKTINLPKDFPFEKLADIYTQAYLHQLKGCTVFRPNPISGSVLESSHDDEKCCQHE